MGLDRKEYVREWNRQKYLNDPNYREKRKQNLIKIRKRNRDFVNELKSVPCKDCGQTYPPYVMDFDHVRGKKKFEIGDLSRQSCSIEKILKEALKCDIVCSNCHRVRTHGK